MNRVLSQSAEQTEKIAETFSKGLKGGDIICLKGDLGAGKTHFVRGFVKGFGLAAEVVSSPTFTIINEYDGTIPIYHFDCYRLEHFIEAIEIGAEEYFYGNGITIIEWPEKIQEILPDYTIDIRILVTGKEKRELIFPEQLNEY